MSIRNFVRARKPVVILVTCIALATVVFGAIGLSMLGKGPISERGILINEVFYSENFCAWFEVYNPTNRTIDTQGWLVWFYSINGPIHLPQMDILPGEYVVICPNEELVREQWDLPSDVRVFEMDFGARYDSISISAGGLTEEATGIDGAPDGAKFQALEPGHSWARYAGGRDTGNFANDFYDEPHPTPGRPSSPCQSPCQKLRL